MQLCPNQESKDSFNPKVQLCLYKREKLSDMICQRFENIRKWSIMKQFICVVFPEGLLQTE